MLTNTSETCLAPTKTDYIVAFLFLCVSGNPLFLYGTEWSAIILLGVMLFVCIAHHSKLFSKELLIWLGGLIILFSLQYITLPRVSVAANVSFISKIYLAFLVIAFLGEKFRYTYLRLMYWLSIVSLCFFVIQILIEPIGFSFGRYKTLFIFNTIPSGSGLGRNSGMFWEPGAFQGFLILVPLLYFNNLKFLWNSYRKECVVLIITLLTTQSTTGYIALTVILAYVLAMSNVHILTKYFLICFIGIGIVLMFTQLSFLEDKITDEYAATIALKEGELSWSRMGSFYLDYQNILHHPFIGNGFLMEMRYGALGRHLNGISNGFTGAINMYGIVTVLFYYICVYRRLKNYNRIQRVLFLATIIILLNGEYYMSYPLFWGLVFIDYSLQYDGEYETENSCFINSAQS